MSEPNDVCGKYSDLILFMPFLSRQWSGMQIANLSAYLEHSANVTTRAHKTPVTLWFMHIFTRELSYVHPASLHTYVYATLVPVKVLSAASRSPQDHRQLVVQLAEDTQLLNSAQWWLWQGWLLRHASKFPTKQRLSLVTASSRQILWNKSWGRWSRVGIRVARGIDGWRFHDGQRWKLHGA